MKLYRISCATAFCPRFDMSVWLELNRKLTLQKSMKKPAPQVSKLTHLQKMVGLRFIRPPKKVTPSACFNHMANMSNYSMSSGKKSNKSVKSIPSKSKTGSSASIQHSSSTILLDLMQFKTQPCKILQAHNPKKCLYYHDAKLKDRRRVPTTYTSEICPIANT